MILSAYEIALIAGGFTIVGALITYFLSKLLIQQTHQNDVRIIQLTEFNRAAAEFRAAFAPAIAKFKVLSDANLINDMLRDELIPQSVALEKFRPFISPDEQSAYQEAWEEYHQSHQREGVSSVYFLDYALGDEKERFKLFNDRINKILKFTEK